MSTVTKTSFFSPKREVYTYLRKHKTCLTFPLEYITDPRKDVSFSPLSEKKKLVRGEKKRKR